MAIWGRFPLLNIPAMLQKDSENVSKQCLYLWLNPEPEFISTVYQTCWHHVRWNQFCPVMVWISKQSCNGGFSLHMKTHALVHESIMLSWAVTSTGSYIIRVMVPHAIRGIRHAFGILTPMKIKWYPSSKKTIQLSAPSCQNQTRNHRWWPPLENELSICFFVKNLFAKWLGWRVFQIIQQSSSVNCPVEIPFLT